MAMFPTLVADVSGTHDAFEVESLIAELLDSNASPRRIVYEDEGMVNNHG